MVRCVPPGLSTVPGDKIMVISIVVVDYLVKRLEKVSPKVPSVLIAPFVPGGQCLVPGAEKRSPGQKGGYSSLAWYRDLKLLQDKLEEARRRRDGCGFVRKSLLRLLYTWLTFSAENQGGTLMVIGW